MALEVAHRLLHPELSPPPIIQLDTPGSRLHEKGSSGFWSLPVNLAARVVELQTRVQIPILRDQLKKHPQSNPGAFSAELSRRMLPGTNSLIIPNADVAWAAFGAIAHSQDPLVQDLQVNTLVTDHFGRSMHNIWATAHGNSERKVTMYVLDELSKRAALRLLDSQWGKVWGKRTKPEIIVNPFPIDPDHEEIMSKDQQDKREQALDPNNFYVRPDVFLLLGGASVQAEYMAIVSEIVGTWSKTYSTFKDRPETRGLAQSILKRLGKVDVVSDNMGMIQALNHQWTSSPADIIVVKPGEISNYALLPTIAVGGGIMLFSPPVGDQEEQNLDFLRSEKLLPSKIDNEQLIHDLLNKPSNHTKNYWLRRAGELRSICLPKNPYEARTFIYSLYTNGILLEIFQRFKHLVPPRGAEKLWQQLESRK